MTIKKNCLDTNETEEEIIKGFGGHSNQISVINDEPNYFNNSNVNINLNDNQMGTNNIVNLNNINNKEIIQQIKEESEIDKYMRKLGIWLDERNLKTVLVSKIKGRRNK